MTNATDIETHYRHGALLEAIRSGIEQLGKSTDSLEPADLAPMDEFHIGGRQASSDFFAQLSMSPGQHWLDIGCGLGGAARFIAERYQCRVTGIDLCAEYIETGQVLNQWLGLDGLVSLQQGSALDGGFEAESFDGACMLHVGMNIPDKQALFNEVFRVLRPGGRFGIYDVMQCDTGELSFPVPWATRAADSALASPEQYRNALGRAGFRIQAERNRRQFALDFFAGLRQQSAAATTRPALGLHILMGDSAPLKVKNTVANIASGRIAPVELIAQKPG